MFGMLMLFTGFPPVPSASVPRGSSAGSLLRESRQGWIYIRVRHQA
jgi:hypothetical protein